MKKLWAAYLVLASLLFIGATPQDFNVRLFTFFPNSPPIDSDFFVLQRNQGFINSTPAQVRQFFFTQPSFTGNGFISGQWHVGGGIWLDPGTTIDGDGRGLTNILVGVTNTVIPVITNNTFVNTNIFISTSNAYFTTEIVSNVLFATTNESIYNITTNLITQNISTTNITVIQPGGATNFNLTPNSLMQSDNNDAESSLPNAVGILTNNGTGGMGWATTITFTEIDALNAYLTNMFTFLTNKLVLATDANGKLIAGAPGALLSAGANITITTNGDSSLTIAASGTIAITTITNNTFVNTNFIQVTSNAFFNNIYVTNASYIDTFTNNFFINTNTVIITGKANVNNLNVTNITIQIGGGGLTNLTIATNSAVITDANHDVTNAVSQHGVFTNTAAGPPSFGLLQNSEMANSSITIQGSAVALGSSTLAAGSSPAFNAVNFTNWNGSMPTNNGNGNALVFGGPNSTATASTFYETNFSANTTLAAFDITHTPNTASGIKIFAQVTGGTDRTLTFPNGCTGAGLGTPPSVTVTNGTTKGAYFDVIFKPAGTLPASTNVFWSPVF